MIARSRLVAGALLALCGSCVTAGPPPTQNASAVSMALYQDELRLAREALGRSEWEAARQHLDALAEAVPAQDPVGAEARAGLAQIAFELGDYPRAAQVGLQVPANAPQAVQALEYAGLANLFSCNFDQAVEIFARLGAINPARGHMWLGMAYAWTGQGANAVRELDTVVQQFGQSEEVPNATFYLAQLAVWENRLPDARAYFGRLRTTQAAGRPYLDDLDERAGNWLQRRQHLMRAFFTFDTRERLDEIARDTQSFVRHDQGATQAMQALQAQGGTACAAHVARLAEARTAITARRAQAEQMAAAQRAEYERQHADDDGDGIPNVSDRCPPQAETYNGLRDQDGCPEADALIYFLRGSNQLVFRQGIMVHFGTGSAALAADSEPIIQQIVGVWRAFQLIRKIRVEGHTDDIGDPARNMELSQQRANAVALRIANLMSIPADQIRDRIEFVGRGALVPLAQGSGEDDRARNRRVEITVIDPPMLAGTGGIWSAQQPR